MSRLKRLERQEASIREEKKLARLEDTFVAKKEAGLARRADEKADAFKAAKSAEEYEALVAQIEPANTAEEKRVLRTARQEWRLNHRVSKSNAAQPATIGVTAAPEEV